MAKRRVDADWPYIIHRHANSFILSGLHHRWQATRRNCAGIQQRI